MSRLLGSAVSVAVHALVALLLLRPLVCLRRQVERALDAERGRWVDFSYTRLRQFGYRFDTY